MHIRPIARVLMVGWLCLGCCCLTCGDDPGRLDQPPIPPQLNLTQTSQFMAVDSLEIGQESSADARQCLDGLAWPREQFPVYLQQARERQGNWLVRFPSARPVGDPVNDLAAMEWYQACDVDGQPVIAPGVVVVHESGSGMTVGRLIAKSLRSKGIHSFMLQLPYYGVRRTAAAQPRGQEITEALCQSVVDARRARDAVACLPYVDARCICLQGTSLGGFVTATTAGLDQAYQHVFVLLAGGDLYSVLMQGQKDAAKVRQAMMADGSLSNEQFQTALQRIEPLRLAHRVDPSRLWLFSGRYDDVVPPKNSALYAKAVGLEESHHIQLMANHYSGIIFLPLISEQISQLVHGEVAQQQ